MTKQDGNVLWNPWIDLWNGDLAVAEEIIHPEFALHRIPHPRIPDKAGGPNPAVACQASGKDAGCPNDSWTTRVDSSF